jgi:acyl dehydratase
MGTLHRRVDCYHPAIQQFEEQVMSESGTSDLVAQLRAAIGLPGGRVKARDKVNQAMIRHWCDAMQDHNPVHVDPDAAAKSVHGAIVAPPAMLNAWTMQGLLPPHLRAADAPASSTTTYGRLDAAGYTSVVATNSEHDYDRYLRLGDDLTGFSTLTEVSEEKHTGLGIGHFVTTETEYRNQDDEVVGHMLFRILKFKPGTGRVAAAAGAGGETAQTPHPTDSDHNEEAYPARPERRETTLLYGEVEEGTVLAPCPIPITATLIVSTAIASRDYQDVHHDRELAIKRGSPDIFMNILTTSGLCSRYVTDWAGPEAILRRLAIRLGVPNYPHDTMTMTAQVTEKKPGGLIEVALRGSNRLGNHVTGTITLELPS